jgi:cyclase
MLLKEKIKGVTDKPVTYLINTHYHGDHTFGNQYFPGAVIVSHANTRALLIEKGEAHRERFMGFFGPASLEGFVLTLPALTFTDRLTLRSGDTAIEIIYARHTAHTTGDIFVFLPAEKVVFAGDLLYNGRLPLLDDGDSSGAIAALDSLTETGALKFVPGHGAVSGPEGVILYRGYLTELRGEVRWLKEKGRSLEEVMEEIDLPRYSGYVNYKEWLPANAAHIYRELQAR